MNYIHAAFTSDFRLLIEEYESRERMEPEYSSGSD